ncbi:TVP38/TMEM64 family protein [Clostridium tagluense]|uniref:TVP38/TMEM64 family membrane protein n=1 Tax=Clostridium tagluense TaxID=360422 RepID=A0A401UPW6_9CLOT|nr:TVP38/TMEM64 family protein [Clostridium tagluense]MCB2300754.1 TVP38/TMEM64 family protein [Clostridium tagluense]GCD11579.1 TVP38/TMEM64 family protein [Clostridium tagluense]
MKLSQFIKKHRNLILISTLIIITLILGCKYRQYLFVLKSPEEFKNFITSFGYYGIFIFILSQFLQVTIFFIPGEVIQATGGWIYGTLGATILSLIGITLGSILLFLLSKKYGRPLVNKFISETKLKSIEAALNSKKLNLIVFLIYFLPGIPRDSLIFACGISKMSLKKFLVYSTFGRIPALVLSCYLGSNMLSCSKPFLFLMLFVMVLIFLIGVFKGEYLLEKLSNN